MDKTRQGAFHWRTVAAIAAIVCVGFYLYTSARPLPTGSGPAGPPVPSEAFGQVWSERPVLLVGLGDSITRGFGAPPGLSDFDLLVRNDDSACPDMRGQDLGSVYPSLKQLNRSVSGTSSFSLLESQIPGFPRQDAGVRGVVVITTGGNDLIHWYGRQPPSEGALYGCTVDQARTWAANYGRRLDRIVAAVNSRFPGGCDVFLANIYDPTDGVGDAGSAPVPLPDWPDSVEVLGLYNREIEAACRRHGNAHLVDIHALFLGHGTHCRDWRGQHYRRDDPHYWYFTNFEDPNARGYDAIRRAFLLEMIRVLRPEP